MDKNFWLDKWENSDIKFNQTDVNPYLKKYFNTLKLPKGSAIFVPLCGKSIDLIWLSQQGYQIIGNELSSIACRDFFEENHLEYKIKTIEPFECYYNNQFQIYCGDFFELNSKMLGSFEAVYDRGGLVALPAELRTKYVNQLIQLITSPCKIFLISCEYHFPDVQGPPFSVTDVEVHQLYKGHFTITILSDIAQKATDIHPHLLEKGIHERQHRVYLMEPLK